MFETIQTYPPKLIKYIKKEMPKVYLKSLSLLIFRFLEIRLLKYFYVLVINVLLFILELRSQLKSQTK